MRGWYRYVSYYVTAESIGGFTIVSLMMYGQWRGGFTATTKLAVFLHLTATGAGLALLYRGWSTRSIPKGTLQAAALACLFMCTAIWSVDPDTSFRRGTQYLLFVLCLAGVASNFDGDEYFDMIDNLCQLSALLSFLLIVVYPAQAWMGGSDITDPTETGSLALQGIFSHKNVLGEVMAAGALAICHRLRTKRISIFWGLARAFVYLFTVLLSRSGTSTVVAFLIYAVNLVIFLFRRGGAYRGIGVVLAFVLAVAVPILLLAPDIVLEMLGKDPTLSGRTLLWAIVEAEISDRPILGWGFFAFWGPANPLAGEIFAQLRFSVPHAHNALLEMLLEVGVVGTTVILAILLRNMRLAWRCLRTPARDLGISALLGYGAIIFTGATESVLLDSSTIYSGMFFVFGFLCERALRANALRLGRAVASAEVRFRATTLTGGQPRPN
jgi:exopolysaccharide production protein ExoQ